MKEGWVKKKLGEVCETSSGGTPTKSRSEFYENGNIPWLRSGELNKKYILDSELHITELGMEKSSAKLFPINTVVIAMYGATVGQVSILKKEMTTNQAICGILPNKTSTPEYLYYFLKSKKDAFVKDAVGGAQPNISQNLIKSTYLLYPPLPEQQQIVAELDCLQGIIDKKKEQLQELDKLAQSIFYTMFGDPVENEKGWEVKKIGDIAQSDLGKTLNKSKDTGNYHPYLCAINIQWNKIDFSSLKEARFQSEEISKYSVSKGDLLICEGGDIGRAAIWNRTEPMLYQNALHRVRFTKEVLAIYCLYHLFTLKKNNILDTKYSKGVTIKHLVKSSLLSIPIPVPPLPLQQEFADKITAIEQQKTRIQQSLQDTETLFQSRMDYYFG